MPLNDREYLQVCEALQRAYPDDPRPARLWIRALVEAGEHKRAAQQALAVAQRMVAQGMAPQAVGFVEIARRYGAEGADVDRLAEMARLAAMGGAAPEPGRRRVFELIEPLSDEEAEEFLRRGRLRAVKDGDPVLHQGERSTSFYLILRGAFEVRIAHEDREEAIGLLQAGDFFGEVAAIYDLPRSASIIARGDGALLEFTAADVRWLAQTFPLAGEYLLRVIERRVLHTLARAHPAFAELPEEDRLWVAEEAHIVELKSAEELSPQERGEDLWIVVHGELALVRRQDGSVRTMALGSDDAFGGTPEMQLGSDVRVVAAERCLLARIPRRIAQALSQAYAGFSLWLQQQGKRLQRALGDASTEAQ